MYCLPKISRWVIQLLELFPSSRRLSTRENRKAGGRVLVLAPADIINLMACFWARLKGRWHKRKLAAHPPHLCYQQIDDPHRDLETIKKFTVDIRPNEEITDLSFIRSFVQISKTLQTMYCPVFGEMLQSRTFPCSLVYDWRGPDPLVLTLITDVIVDYKQPSPPFAKYYTS